MFSIALTLHILGAFAVGATVLGSILAILRNASSFYAKLLYVLTGGLILQALTGSLLELTSAHPTLFLVFCSKIFFYLGVVVVTQFALITKMLKLDMKVSYNYISYSSAFTVLAVCITGLLLR